MNEIESYRSAFSDALGFPIPMKGEIRLWLDDDVVDRCALEGWVHLRTVREVCMLLLTDRVIELSLDNDLEGDVVFGQGSQVIDFLEEMQAVHDVALWPRDGVTLHTANPAGRDKMIQAIENLPRSVGVDVERSNNSNTQPHFDFRVP